MVDKIKATKTSTRKKPNKRKNDLVSFEFDYDKLAEAIVSAEIKAKELLTKEKKNKKQSKEKLTIKDGIKVFWKLMFFKREDANDDSMTFIFLKLAAEFIVLIIEKILFFIGFICVLSPIVIQFSNISAAFGSIIMTCIFGAIMIMFSRFIRVSRFEIDNLDDREYLNTIIGSLLAFIGTIIAVIELVRRPAMILSSDSDRS